MQSASVARGMSTVASPSSAAGASGCGSASLGHQQPVHTGRDGSPASNSIHTPAPTAGTAKKPVRSPPKGAQGIAQFMPATARDMGLDNPFDAARAIDAQAHLMRDLLRQFGAVALALAAYNAGPAPVSACGCVPPYPETRGYVARILGLMSGAGELLGGAGAGLSVRLVR